MRILADNLVNMMSNMLGLYAFELNIWYKKATLKKIQNG